MKAEQFYRVVERVGRGKYVRTKTLQKAILFVYPRNGETIACAESCTGGLVAKLLTDLSGASEVFVGGFVTYCDEMKQTMLGVSKEALDAHHAVSAEVAIEMARGAREQTGATVAVSTTGVAGPSPDDSGKLVGTVYLGLADSIGRTVVREFHFKGTRRQIRKQAAKEALLLLFDQPFPDIAPSVDWSARKFRFSKEPHFFHVG